MTKPNTHGGQRPGAGRKPIGDLIPITIKIPRELKDRIQCPNLSKLIRDLLEVYAPKSAAKPKRKPSKSTRTAE